MSSPYDAGAAADAFAEQLDRLELSLMQDIVEAIREAGEITSATDYKIERLYKLGVPKDVIRETIRQALEISEEDMEALYRQTAEQYYVRSAALYEAQGLRQIPLAENLMLRQLIAAEALQTCGELRNLADSIGFLRHAPDGSAVFSPAAEYYHRTVDQAVQELVTGAYDYNTVIRKAVREMTASGLRVIDFESGTTRRADGHIRTVVMTGASQITAKISEMNMDALGTEYVEVDWHSGARPSHQVWQGRVYRWNRHTGAQPETTVATPPDSGQPPPLAYDARDLTEWQSDAIIGTTTNAAGKKVYIVNHVDVRNGPPDGITQWVSKKGGIDRNYYDENGVQTKQVSNHDHGHKAESAAGEHGEHAHDCTIDDSGIFTHKKWRELTETERKENGDIL